MPTYEIYDPAGSSLMQKRLAAGMPVKNLGQSEVAKNWENIVDRAIDPSSAGSLVHGSLDPSILEKNPWLYKVNPEAEVYSVKGLRNNFGFEHIIDELRNATNPDSGLPRDLLLKPESLNKLSVSQAVERVAKINAWRAAQKAEADMIRANNAATVLHKEYPHSEEMPNPEGLRWVELTAPKHSDVLPEGWSEPVAKGDTLLTKSADGKVVLGNSIPELVKNIYKRHPETPGNPEKILEDALKYEGDTMGHCVGGYCPDVMAGRSRIYSLRNAKGEPHVTIEVKPRNVEEGIRNLPDAERQALAQEIKDQHFGGVMPGVRDEDKYFNLIDQAYIFKYGMPPPSITQIKGKGNAKPADKYLPFVQDFVRSGQWSDVGDLQNTGMIRRGNVFTPTEKKGLIDLGQDVPEYLTQEDIKRLRNIRGDLLPEEGMKSGGKVGYTDCGSVSMDAMRLAVINKQLRKHHG